MNMTVFQILLSLREGAQSASDILATIRDLDERGRVPSLASFYRNLKRCVDEGWLEIAEEKAPAKTAGRPGQVYRITKEGRSAVGAEGARLQRLVALAISGDPLPKPKSADV